MIIGLCSYKGGVGKTTLSIHLAQYLSSKGESLLIDGNEAVPLQASKTLEL